MSESESKSKSESRKGRRSERGERTPSTAPAEPTGPAFTVAASGENVVLVNLHNGQSWVMATDNGQPVWHPVTFQGSAARAPRRVEKQNKKGGDAE